MLMLQVPVLLALIGYFIVFFLMKSVNITKFIVLATSGSKSFIVGNNRDYL